MKIAWWQWLPVWRWRILGSVDDADEVPDRLPRRAAVVVGTSSFSKWIAFDCACGRKHRIMLNTEKIMLVLIKSHSNRYCPYSSAINIRANAIGSAS